jgi:hypothetical protein
LTLLKVYFTNLHIHKSFLVKEFISQDMLALL